MRLSILCENSVIPSLGILGEHGFAVLVEKGKELLLFDTGQGHTIVHNAQIMHIDLSRIRRILLSHGHYDHTGGLAGVLEHAGSSDVCAHPDVFTERYAVLKANGAPSLKYIGPPENRETYEKIGAHFIFNTSFSEICPDVYLTGEVPRTSGFELPDKRLVVKQGAGTAPDPLRDDQSLVVKTARGLVVVLGCAHAGLINTLKHVCANLPEEPLHMVLGGTHVGYLEKEQVQCTIEALKEFSFDRIGVSHCTGLGPAMRFMQAFEDRFFFASAGTVLEV